MTSHKPRRPRRRWQQAWSNRVHAGGDAAARSHGWTVTVTSTRSGLSGRVYRDPRFAARILAGSSIGQRRAEAAVAAGCDAPGDLPASRPHPPQAASSLDEVLTATHDAFEFLLTVDPRPPGSRGLGERRR